MSTNADVAQRRRLNAVYMRWNQIRMQLGPAASQNEEFVTLSRILQQATRQAPSGSGQPPFRSGDAPQRVMTPRTQPGAHDATHGAHMSPTAPQAAGSRYDGLPTKNPQLPPQMTSRMEGNPRMPAGYTNGAHFSQHGTRDGAQGPIGAMPPNAAARDRMRAMSPPRGRPPAGHMSVPMSMGMDPRTDPRGDPRAGVLGPGMGMSAMSPQMSPRMPNMAAPVGTRKPAARGGAVSPPMQKSPSNVNAMGMPAGMPASMHAANGMNGTGGSPGMSNGLPNGMPNGMHSGMSNGMSNGMGGAMANNMGQMNGMNSMNGINDPSSPPNDPSSGHEAISGMANGLSNAMSAGMGSQMSNGMMNGMPQVIPGQLSNGMPGSMSQMGPMGPMSSIPGQAPGAMSSEMLQLPGHMPGTGFDMRQNPRLRPKPKPAQPSRGRPRVDGDSRDAGANWLNLDEMDAEMGMSGFGEDMFDDAGNATFLQNVDDGPLNEMLEPRSHPGPRAAAVPDNLRAHDPSGAAAAKSGAIAAAGIKREPVPPPYMGPQGARVQPSPDAQEPSPHSSASQSRASASPLDVSLLTPAELLVLNQQEQALRALQANQPIAESIRKSLLAPTGLAKDLPKLPVGRAPEVKQQHIEQHEMERELGLRHMRQKQWDAQQRQEKLYQQHYVEGENNDVAFVVQGGRNISSAQRSRRLQAEDVAAVSAQEPPLDLRGRFGFDHAADPASLLPDKVPFTKLYKYDELLVVPALRPEGFCAQEMHSRRAAQMQYLFAKRREELETIQKSRPLTLDEDVDLRRLRLAPYLRALRGDLLAHIQYFDSVALTRSNIVMFARMKFLTQHDAALVERFVGEQSLERRKNENLGQHTRFQKLLGQRAELARVENNKRAQHGKLVSAAREYHLFVEREERKRYERTAKQRLQLLRANDEDAYLKLIDQTKDARITHLLRQTNKFLSGLAQAVKNQQGDDAEPKNAEGEAEADTRDPKTGGDIREKVDYYEVAHRVKEPVTKQPSILVGGTLKEYQLKGLQWMVSLYNNKLNGILADEMGLGKTIQSIALITYLIEVKNVKGPFLVLVPLSTLTNWDSEFDTWAPSVRKVVYRGPPATRKQYQNQIRCVDFQVLLTTYEYVIKERALFSRIHWEHMIIDEGHRMKNTQSKLSSTLAQYYRSKYRLILTGTPLQNNLPELWALLNFVLPKIFNSVKSFEEWFNTPFLQAGSSDKMDLGEEEKLLIIRRLHKVLRPFLLRRLKKDVEQDLPDKIERIVKCRMSALQQFLYHQLLGYSTSSLGSQGSGGIRSLSNRVMQLRKLCNHPFVFEEVERVVNPSAQNNDLLWRTAGKFELLDRVLPKFKRAGHRTLIFFQMTQIMDIMEDFLRLRGIRYLRLDGMTKADMRSDLLKKFNDPESPYFCFLLSTRAGGLGLNLQTADTVIIYDTDWNPHQDLQAQDRAHRIGQTKEVLILRLITENSIEKHILDRAQGKLDIDDKVIQAGKFDNKSTNEEQEAFLRTLLIAQESKGENDDPELDEMDDENLNMLLARSEEERQLFNEMDYERVQQERAVNAPPRLFSEPELPKEYTKKDDVKLLALEQESHTDERGHHLRIRRTYDDDNEENRKRQKFEDDSEESQKRVAVASNAISDGSTSTPSPAPSTADILATLPKPRPGRKGRPPRVKETLTPEARENLTEVGKQLIRDIKAVVDSNGRHRVDLFLELPSRSLYPDYFQLIVLPICISTISKRISTKFYQSFEQMANDWRTMFRNARWYNAEGSVVYNDADCLEAVFERSYTRMVGVLPSPYIDVLGTQPVKPRSRPNPFLPSEDTFEEPQHDS